jgi:integrase
MIFRRGFLMPTIKLTDAAVQRLKAPDGGRIDYFDATLPGFGVRVSGKTDRSPDGRRTWILFYRLRGTQRRLTLEPTYPGLSLADARKQAGDALALVSKGIDPAAEKAKTKAPIAKTKTLTEVLEDYLQRGLTKKGRSLSYVTETRRNFANHVLPRWGERALTEIVRKDVIAMLDDIAESGTDRKVDGKKVHIAGGPIAANRVLSAVRALFNWAIRRGLVEVNPCALVERPGHEEPRDRTLSASEVRELWPQFGALGYPFGPFFQLCLVTGQRRTEVAEMRWADVDLAEKTWTLSADQTKAGRAHVVPLSQMAIDLLQALPRKAITEKNGTQRPSPFVFTTEGDTPISGFSRAKERIETRLRTARVAADPEAEAMAAWGIHDLRRTAATEMGRLGIAEFIISKVLNHAARGVTGRVYNTYEYLAEKRHALDTWAAYLTRLLQPAERNVLVLSGRRA